MSRKTMERFFDEEDFTSSHDEIFEHLLAHWTDYVLPLVKDKEYNTTISNGKIRGEPALDGYPPLFPDAIATGTIYANHRDLPMKTIVSVEDTRYLIEHQCTKCGRTVREQPYPLDKPHQPFFYTKTAETEKKLAEYAQQLVEWEKKVAEIKQQYEKPRYWNDLCNLGSFQTVFEIKPNKESAGRILRQLNIYKERLGWNDLHDYECRYKQRFMILITPDSRFDELFKSQGVIPVRPLNLKLDTNKDSLVKGACQILNGVDSTPPKRETPHD